MNKKQLHELKKGDQVTVKQGGRIDVGTVIRLTKTQIVMRVHNSQHKFNRVSGWPVGRSGYNPIYIHEMPVESAKQIVWRRNVEYKIQTFCDNNELAKLPDGELKKILDIIKQVGKDNE